MAQQVKNASNASNPSGEHPARPPSAAPKRRGRELHGVEIDAYHPWVGAVLSAWVPINLSPADDAVTSLAGCAAQTLWLDRDLAAPVDVHRKKRPHQYG